MLRLCPGPGLEDKELFSTSYVHKFIGDATGMGSPPSYPSPPHSAHPSLPIPSYFSPCSAAAHSALGYWLAGTALYELAGMSFTILPCVTLLPSPRWVYSRS